MKTFKPLPCDREIVSQAMKRLEMWDFVQSQVGLTWTEESMRRLKELWQAAGGKETWK